MMINHRTSPAGYGYFLIDSVANEDIMQDVKAHLIQYDSFLAGNACLIQSMSIQVGADCYVRVNGRAPVLVKADFGLSFDSMGVTSLVFTTSGIKYNIALSY